MLHRTGETTFSRAVRVFLSCTVLVMFSAMLRTYQDTEAPHDMYPGLESCRHIKDLARHKFDGDYLIRSELVAQLASLWSQSDCSRYTALLSDSPREAEARTSQEHTGSDKGRYDKESRRAGHSGPALNSADASHRFTGTAMYNPVLVGDLSIVSIGTMTFLHAPATHAFFSRADDVPSPPPRALG